MVEVSEFSPEEKLFAAIFGAKLQHLPPEGKKVVNDTLTQLEDRLATFPPGMKGMRRIVEVLRLRFGFVPRTSLEQQKNPRYSSNSRTLGEVGAHFSLSPERMRQTEMKGLRMLRHPIRSGRLREYIHE